MDIILRVVKIKCESFRRQLTEKVDCFSCFPNTSGADLTILGRQLQSLDLVLRIYNILQLSADFVYILECQSKVFIQSIVFAVTAPFFPNFNV